MLFRSCCKTQYDSFGLTQERCKQTIGTAFLERRSWNGVPGTNGFLSGTELERNEKLETGTELERNEKLETGTELERNENWRLERFGTERLKDMERRSRSCLPVYMFVCYVCLLIFCLFTCLEW